MGAGLILHQRYHDFMGMRMGYRLQPAFAGVRLLLRNKNVGQAFSRSYTKEDLKSKADVNCGLFNLMALWLLT